MRIVFYVLTVAVAALVTWGFSLLILKLSRRYRLYPKIRARDVHTEPTPRLGGVAMFLGVLVAIGVSWFVPPLRSAFGDTWQVVTILLAALIIVVIGVVDDIIDLGWITKLAGQFIAALVLAFGGTQLFDLPFGGIVVPGAFPSLILTVFVVVLVMNAVNFVDGLDGLVAGVAIIANGTFFVYTYIQQSQNNLNYFNLAALITAVLIGCCIGFLPINFHPAKMFMGDSGALLVGLLMAVSAINVTAYIDPGDVATAKLDHSIVLVSFIPILLPFAILILPLLDFGLAILRRIRAGKSPFSADRKHLHHRLLDMGHTHLNSVLLFYAWTLVVSVGLLMFLFAQWWWALAFIVVGFIVTSAFTLAPLGRRRRPRDRQVRREAGASERFEFQVRGSRRMTPAAILVRAVRYEAILTIAILVIGGVLGYVVAGPHGLFAALLGGGVTAVFMGLTAASILVAGRVASGPDGLVMYFGIVLGTWMLKLVLFVVMAIWLRSQSWLDPAVFGVTVIAAVIGSLVVDIIAYTRTRVLYTDAVLPAASQSPPEKSHSDS